MKIGIVGCAGRMGRMLVAETLASEEAILVGGTEHSESGFLGHDIATLAGLDKVGIVVGSDTDDLFSAADVVIDFTLPQATISHAQGAIEHGTALVIGTTGLKEEQQEAVIKASESVAVIQAANFSIGVNLLLSLTHKLISFAYIMPLLVPRTYETAMYMQNLHRSDYKELIFAPCYRTYMYGLFEAT